MYYCEQGNAERWDQADDFNVNVMTNQPVADDQDDDNKVIDGGVNDADDNGNDDGMMVVILWR